MYIEILGVIITSAMFGYMIGYRNGSEMTGKIWKEEFADKLNA